MDIKNARDLSKIITLCRKKGVETIIIGEKGIELKLRESAPERNRRSVKAEVASEKQDEQPVLSAEDRLFWSAGVGGEG